MTRPLRIAVTGGRHYGDHKAVRDALLPYNPTGPHTLVHGGATGADALAASIVTFLGWTVEEWPADWETHGRRAGPIRNRNMIRSGIDVLLVFPGGKGTNNCAYQAQRHGVPIERHGIPHK